MVKQSALRDDDRDGDDDLPRVSVKSTLRFYRTYDLRLTTLTNHGSSGMHSVSRMHSVCIQDSTILVVVGLVVCTTMN